MGIRECLASVWSLRTKLRYNTVQIVSISQSAATAATHRSSAHAQALLAAHIPHACNDVPSWLLAVAKPRPAQAICNRLAASCKLAAQQVG
jgi:hypothetical protein